MNWDAIGAVGELLGSVLDRGCQNPDLLTAEEVVQFNFLLRSYLNQWWKLFKLYERGSLPEAEWDIFAREAAQSRTLASASRINLTDRRLRK
jgi:hypothetical protein